MSRAPWPVRDVENLYVPMPDGIRLAARAWIPVGAPPGPALVEYLPYRKRDATRPRDETLHPLFAAAGRPALRVDVRGTGDADGILLDEYHPQEIEDGVALLAWVAAQPFCDGRVVLLGKSWGGINALMIAARGSPALAGVVAVCATDDRYGNDAHYQGGRLLVENLIWGIGLMAVVAHPPDPRLAGPAWRATWLARLESLEAFPELWRAHPTRDAYWRRGAACGRAADIRCPVLLFGGLEDPYRDAIPRLLAGLGGPRRAVLGPWAHRYPHLGVPGPALDFAAEVLRWMARHLDAGGDHEGDVPTLLAYVTEGRRVEPPADRAGSWHAFDAGVLDGGREVPFGLGTQGLVAGDSTPGRLRVDSPADTGLASGGWCGFGQVGEGPFDQRPDDAGSFCYDSAPLREPFEVVGLPRLHAVAGPEGARALLVARLCEVFPDGHSERVAYGLVDLVGPPAELDLPLSLTAHRFAAGSRVRLALSNAFWPIAWPHPEDGAFVLERGACRLLLPVPGASARSPLPRAFPSAPVPGLPPPPDPDAYRRSIRRDPATGMVVLRTWTDVHRDGAVAMGEHPEIRLHHGHGVEERYAILPRDRRTARAQVTHRFRLAVAGTELDASVAGRMWIADGRTRCEVEMEARENGRVVVRRTW